VIARGDRVIGEGFHRAAGCEHAEISALRSVAEDVRGATLYVTLEPCNHEGKTPPCVDAILDAGVARVVVGCRDPNPSVLGGGIERLRASGVEVVVGVAEAEAKELIRPWSKYVTQGASYLTLKLALSLDGRIATRTGESKWITGEQARLRAQELRARHDAVMVGINTVLTDDPRLTVRDVPGRSPVRVIVDSKLRLRLNSNVVETARDFPACVVTTNEASRAVGDALEEAGLALIRVPSTTEGRCDMSAALRELAAREVVSVLCEGGAELAGSLLAAGLPDELHAFIAPILLGPRGRPGAVDWAGPEVPAMAPRIANPRWELYGPDACVSGLMEYPKKSARG